MANRSSFFTQYLTPSVDNFRGFGGYTSYFGTLGGGSPTVNDGDTLAGGSKFTITDFGDSADGVVPTLHISGIPSIEIDSDRGITSDTSTWQGVKTEDVVTDGSDYITVGDSTVLTLSDSADDDIYTHGGSVVTINNNATMGSYGNYVEIAGGYKTTSVNINNGYDEENYIYDKNYGSTVPNSIKSVSINNQVDYDTYIYSNALTNLSLTGITYHYVYDYGSGSSPALNVNLSNDGNKEGYGDDYWYFEADNSKTITFASSGIGSKNFYLYAPSATALTFTGSADLSFFDGTQAGSDYLEASIATAITISGQGNLTADLSGVADNANIQGRSSGGILTLELDNTGLQSFIGGHGQDIVTIGADQTGLVLGGKNANNEIVLFDAGVSNEGDISSSIIKNFSTLGIDGTTSGEFDMRELSNYETFDIRGSDGDLTFENVRTNSTLSIDSNINNTIAMEAGGSINAPFSHSLNASANLNLGTQSTDGIAVSDVELDNISSVNLVSKGLSTNTLSLLGGNDLLSINLAGSAGLILTDLSSGDLQINGANYNADISITLGDGANEVRLGSGADAVAVGGGANQISFRSHVAGSDTIEVGPNDSFSAFTLISGVDLSDELKIADTTAFNATAVTASQITAAGQSTATLAGWITGTLSATGDNLAENHAAWFQFGGNTYVEEQANATGSAIGSGDTVVEVAGTINLSGGTYNSGAAAIVL